MRLHLDHSLLSVVKGQVDLLPVSVRLQSPVADERAIAIAEFPSMIMREFNAGYTSRLQLIDYATEPIIQSPTDFAFEFMIERLSRLAREYLISLVPLFARLWQTSHDPIAKLWLGGAGMELRNKERTELRRMIMEVHTLPIQGKQFVFGDDIIGLARGAAIAGLEDLDAIVGDELGSNCDYFVTDSPENAAMAIGAGAKGVIDMLTLGIMRSRYTG